MKQTILTLLVALCALAGTANTALAASRTVTYTFIVEHDKSNVNRTTLTFTPSNTGFGYSTGEKTVTIQNATATTGFTVQLDDGLRLTYSQDQGKLTFFNFIGFGLNWTNDGGNSRLKLTSSHYYVTHVKMAGPSGGSALTGQALPWMTASGPLDQDVDMTTQYEGLADYREFSATFTYAQVFGQLTVTYGDPREYAITFNDVEGLTNPNPTTYSVATNTFQITAPTRTGYTLTGMTYTDAVHPNATAVNLLQSPMIIQRGEAATRKDITFNTTWMAISGSCGNNATWEYDPASHTLSITGTGRTNEFGENTRPWEPYKDDITTVSIGDGITSIGNSAFSNCSNLATITGGNGLIRVESSAFSGTHWYEIAAYNNIVNYIGRIAYLCGPGVSGDITLADGTIAITEHAFQSNSAITSVTIPASVTTINHDAFYDCGALATVNVLADTPLTLGSQAFWLRNHSFARTFNVRSAAYKTASHWADIYNKRGEYNTGTEMRVVSTLTLPDGVTASVDDAADKVTAYGTDYYAEGASVTLSGCFTADTHYVVSYYDGEARADRYVPDANGQAIITMPAADAEVSIESGTLQPTTTETKALAAGWNWFSTYCDITLNDLRAALVEAVPGENSITIQSKTQNTTYNPRTNRWTGSISWDVAQMYMIKVNEDCEITLEGMPIDPAAHPVTIHNGDNWIGFPFAQNMSVANAFAGFAVNGDIVISQTASACYSNGAWKGTLKNLEPGQGYIYKSAASGDRTFAYPTEGAADSGANGSFDGESHWSEFNYHNFMYNRPVVAAIMIDGQYVTADNYNLNDMEVAAFVGEECRGNRFTLTNRYVGNGGGQYPVLDGMPVYYNNQESGAVTFRLYANDFEYTDCEILYDGAPLAILTGEDHVEGWMNPEKPIVLSFHSPAVDLVLSDTGANANAIEQNNNHRANVTLQDRTLYKDGAWNTLCLPFNVTVGSGVMEDATAMTLDGETSGFNSATGELTLNFDAVGEGNTIAAGTPFIVKWTGNNVTSPVFTGVTVSNSNHDVTSYDGKVQFKGTYASIPFDSENQSVLFLSANSTLYFPKSGTTINPFRAYFQLAPGTNVREFKLNFGDEETTGVVDVRGKMEDGRSDAWYDLNGRRVKNPAKGVYIVNGKKRVIK